MLIVQKSLSTIYDKSEWEKLISEVRESIEEFEFRELFICDFNQLYSESICYIKNKA